MRTGSLQVNPENEEELEALIQQGKDSVANALTYLTSTKVQNFYARVINSLDRVSVPGFGTMGVTVNRGRYIMAYDPIFAARVSYEEVCATCEHEVMHIILEHIPRYLQQLKLHPEVRDQMLMKITYNLAMDMANNELLARNWPGMRKEEQPLGYWVLPTNFDPPLPADASFEVYHKLLSSLLQHRLQTSASHIYQMAKAILHKQEQAIKQALQKQSPQQQQQQQQQQAQDSKGEPKQEEGDKKNAAKGESPKSSQTPDPEGQPDSPGNPSQSGQGTQQTQDGQSGNQPQQSQQGNPQDSQQGQGQKDDLDSALSGLKEPGQQGQGQGGGQGGGQGQGEGQGQGGGQGSGQAQGEGQHNPYADMSADELQQEVNNLDAVDQEVLKMLMSSMPSHLGWDEGATAGDEGEAHQLAEHGREIIKNAIKSHDKSRGTLPGYLLEMIRKMLLPPTVSWTEFLHTLVQRTRQTKKERGMSRPSKILSAMKKYAQIKVREDAEGDTPIQRQMRMRFSKLNRLPVFPGTKHSNKFTIVMAIDTSGSMSTVELQRGLSELQHIQKSDSDVNICVIYADTDIGKEYWVGPSDEIDPNLCGRGGTDFEPIFARVAELLRTPDKAPDILVFCTDGYAPPPRTRLPIPTVWLLTPRGQPVMSEAGHITLEMRDYQLGESY